MQLFLKMLGRDLKNNKGQFISILIVVTIGIAFFTGLNSTLRNLSAGSEQYFRDYRLGDLWVYFSKAPENVLDRIRRIAGVSQASGRMVQDVKLNPPEKNIIIRLITLPDSKMKIVNDIILKSGRYFTTDDNNQCLLEEAFFAANGLELGDDLRVIVNGKEIKLKIMGTVKSPEYIYQLRDSSELFPNPLKFGIAYMKESYGKLLFNFKGSINEASVCVSRGSDTRAVQDKLEHVLESQGLKEITPRKEQLSYDTFRSEIDQLTAIGQLFPMMFLLVAALITYITMNRMVENQRILIGTLKAMGYSNSQILGYYLSFAVALTVAGSILGLILGRYLNQFMLGLYNTMYQLPLENMHPQYDLIVPAALLALLFGLLAIFNAAKNELCLAPGESMRPKAPKDGQKTLFERIKILWNWVNFSWKIILRNLSRYKRRIAMAASGIALATSLLLTAFGMKDSLNYMMEQQFTKAQQFDLKVNLNQFVNLHDLSYLNNLPHVIKMEPMVEMGIELRNGWLCKKMGLTVLARDAQLYKISTKDGTQVTLPERGILVPDKISRLLQLKPGDKVKLKVLWPGKLSDEDQKEIAVKGSVAQYVGSSAYGSMEQVNRFFEEGRIANVILLKLDDQKAETEAVSKIREVAAVGSVQSKAESIKNLQKALDSFNSMVVLFIGAAGALAFAVIYNITNINIHERQRELATLKVLGFSMNEMKQLIFNENFIMTILGTVAGLPLGGVLLETLMQNAATDNMALPAVLFGESYLRMFGLMLIFTISANLVLTRKIRAINMVEALKSSE